MAMRSSTALGSESMSPIATLAEAASRQANENRIRQNRLGAMVAREQEARIATLFEESLLPIEDSIEDLTESVADLNAEFSALVDRLTAVENALE